MGGEKQARETLIVATSNLSLDEFDALEKTADARGRLTSRFQAHEVCGPSHEDIIPLLSIWLPPEQAKQLAICGATGANGKPDQPINVRAILKDAMTWLQQ